MIIEGILLGILIGKLKGGRFKRLGHSILKLPWIIFFAFSLQLLTSIMISLGETTIIKYRLILYALSYCLLIISLFFNIQFQSIWFIIIGSLANFIAIIFNGGSMPIDINQLRRMKLINLLTSIETGGLPQYISIEKAAGYTKYLGKILATPNIYPLKQIFSVGDLLVVLGIFLLIQKMMLPNIYNRDSKVLKLDHKGKIIK